MSVTAIDPTTGTAVPARDEFTLAMRRDRRRRRTSITISQLVLLVIILLAWQFLPEIEWLRERFTFLDPFFISSPTEIASTLGNLLTGSANEPKLWDYAWPTLKSAVLGTFIGTALGAGLGLLLSNMPFLSDVLRPYIIALNAVPRIALIPIIVILWGPTTTASMVTAVTVVFFVVFFNAYEGGCTVAPHVLQNARILGASPFQQMLRVRARYVLAWTVTALPNAVSFGLLSVVTAEVLSGIPGMGRLLLEATTQTRADLTFAVVITLSVLGIVLVGATELLRRRWLRWWSDVG